MVQDKVILNLDAVNKNVCRCNELEERCKKAEVRCVELEFEIHKKSDQCEALEAKLKALEAEKFAVEQELKVLSVPSDGLKGGKEVGDEKGSSLEAIVDLTDEDEVIQLMIENKVLDCEKKKAQSEVEFWKDKCTKLESQALQLGLGKCSHCHKENDGKNEDRTHLRTVSDFKVRPSRHIRKLLAFENEESPSQKMAPSTPSVAKSASVGVIDITDSDDEPNITQPALIDNQGGNNVSVLPCVEENQKSSDSYARNNEEDLGFGEDVPFVATQKRKRTCNVVTSDSEHDDNEDDDMPICKYVDRLEPNSSLMAASEADKVAITATPRRRLVPVSKCVRKIHAKKSPLSSNKAKNQQTIPTDGDASEEDSSNCEDEGLSDFIIDDSDVSDSEDTSGKLQDESKGDEDSDSRKSKDVPDKDMSSDSQDDSDGDVDFGKILSQIQRRKDHKMEWEFEADMLAAFGKDPELCMKAVCALYKRQTHEEQMSRGSLNFNKRGFSKFDAHRASTVSEFLTNGDPNGGLKKCVEELQEHDPIAVDLCRTLAIRYSKQLYEIYKNKEDPFFP